ncbi:hypothetical protein D3C87_410900 [compost metagenome]
MNFIKYCILGLFLTPAAHAYLSMAESGELVPLGKYQVGIAPQFLTNRGGGTNVDVYFDAPINESTSARITMGGGAVDFNAFASAKWIPFPDVDNQPAMGVRAGAGIFRDEGENGLLAQIAPLISKKFDTEYGMTVPYMAVALNFVNSKEENYTGSNIIFGTEFHSTEAQNMTFGAELGAELSKSYSYVTLFVSFPFDSSKGFGN